MDAVTESDVMPEEIAKALMSAIASMENATFNKSNPHFKSEYADLKAVREATLPVLKENGLALSQIPTIEDGQFGIKSILVHKDGKVWCAAFYPINQETTPHQMGAQITYARRYSLAALCGIVANEDDDANAAHDAPEKSTQDIANAIYNKLGRAKDLDALNEEWEKNTLFIEKLKLSEGETLERKAYDYLHARYTKREKELKEGPPIKIKDGETGEETQL